MTKTRSRSRPIVPVREPYKKTSSGIFDNLRQLPHPVEELLGLNPPPPPPDPEAARTVGTHITDPAGTTTAKDVGTDIEPHPGTHQETIAVPTSEIPGTHQQGSESRSGEMEPDVGTHKALVGTKVPTKTGLVGTKVPTTNKAGTHTSKSTGPRRGDRHREGRAQFKVRPDGDILKEVKKFCAARGLTYQEFFEHAAVHFMNAVGTHETGVVGTLVPHDDMMMMINKSDDDIIMLYRSYTGNRWKAADDRVGAEYNGTDRRIIELGILSTLVNSKGKRINSFAYFKPEIDSKIDEVRETKLGDETIDAYLSLARRRWGKIQAERAEKGERAEKAERAETEATAGQK